MPVSVTPDTLCSRRYAPAALGNGSLSVTLGPEGDQRPAEFCGMTPEIVRAGFRLDNRIGELVSFGSFRFGGGLVKTWEQALDPENGIETSRIVYHDGSTLESECFCCFDRDILAIHIRRDTEEEFHFEYELSGRRMTHGWNGKRDIQYMIDTMDGSSGVIRLFADQPACLRRKGNVYAMNVHAREFSIFLCFDCDAEADYETLRQETVAQWNAYHAEMHPLPLEGRLKELYMMCQYHLRVSSTEWAIPTGLYRSHWNGVYFGFDNYFTFMGLLRSDHAATAAKIPRFFASLLPVALGRLNAEFHRTGAARFAWETEEHGLECSPSGFWHDHIFQAGHYTLMCWELFRATGDMELLRGELFPVMRGMMEWIRQFRLIRAEDGSLKAGACTDLDRLGPGRVTPFMTCCSLIAMFEAGAEAAELLGADAELVPLWKTAARDLRKNLPRGNGRYLAAEGVEDFSFGLLAGLYPYGILRDDPLQLETLRIFGAERENCGNMYHVGHGVCSWYVCWEALARIRAGERAAARRLLEELAEETGCFSEMFEIYERGIRPWFTTAEGIFVQAVNELFSEEKQ